MIVVGFFFAFCDVKFYIAILKFSLRFILIYYYGQKALLWFCNNAVVQYDLNLARVYYCYQNIIVPRNKICRVRKIQVKCHVEGKQVFGKKKMQNRRVSRSYRVKRL